MDTKEYQEIKIQPIEKLNLPKISDIEKEYNEKINSLKKNKSWLRFILTGGIIFISLFLVSIVAAHIITGAFALLIAFIILLIGIYGYKTIKKLDPVFQKKLNNYKIKLLIEEAQKRKIETIVSYIQYLEQYLKYSKYLKNKVETLIEKYNNKLNNTTDDYLKKEYSKLKEKLEKAKENLEIIVENSKKKKDEFNKKLEIANEKYNFIKETKEVVDFLENSNNELDKFLVDNSLSKIDEEFIEISTSLNNLVKDINIEDKEK